jgi:hypothetical protein
MTEKETNMLAVFEERVLDLAKLCEKRRRLIEELNAVLIEKDGLIKQAEQKNASLQTKYTNLLAARRLAEDETSFQNARKRVDKLVREVDTCIALLNE